MGTKTFIKVFEDCPDATSLYGFSGDSIEDYMNCPHFTFHARRFIKMLDTVIDMLGPDLETATDILYDLGRIHCEKYGVKADYFAPLGIAIIDTVKEVLMETKHPLTKETEDCWKEVYNCIATDMKCKMK